MSSTLVDSNVLIDLIDDDSEWRDWSDAMLRRAADRGAIVINPIVLAELAAGFETPEELDEVFSPLYYRREPLPWDAAFLAGRAFVQSGGGGGRRPAPLPDFYIGAHAAVAGHALLTRDPARYRFYFPRIRVIAP